MTEEEWLTNKNPTSHVEHVANSTPMPIRKLRLFNVACCYQVESWIEAIEWKKLILDVESLLDDSLNESRIERWEDIFSRRELRGQNQFVGRDRKLFEIVWSICKPSRYYDFPTTWRHLLDEPERHFGQEFAGRISDVVLVLLRDIFGNPFRPVAFDSNWRTATAVGLAQSMYDARHFNAMPNLADALQDAGCEDAAILGHCRDANGVHVRGCWVVDLVLGKS